MDVAFHEQVPAERKIRTGVPVEFFPFSHILSANGHIRSLNPAQTNRRVRWALCLLGFILNYLFGLNQKEYVSGPKR